MTTRFLSLPSVRETAIEEYWDWLAVALYVLVTIDMLTSIYAAWTHGNTAEVNPVMRWALAEGTITLVGVNIAATVIAAAGFYLLMALFSRTMAPYDRVWAFGIQTWLGALIAIGLFVFANNLVVIFHGQSLLGFS